MLKVLNYLCIVEAGLGILLALFLPHSGGYVFGGGLILGSVFTFFIGMGLNMMSIFNDRQKGIDSNLELKQSVESLNKGL